MRRALFFVSSAVAFDEYRLYLKSVPCPRCRGVGHLNRHGHLHGYGEEGSERVVRGWRIFCSNRGRRRGCGRTHSVLLATLLPRRSVRAAQFWKFLQSCVSGSSLKAAWETVTSTFSLECGYRLWKVFVKTQPRLRSLLYRIVKPGDSPFKNSLFQTIEHLHSAFSEAECPLRAFQLHFQQGFVD